MTTSRRYIMKCSRHILPAPVLLAVLLPAMLSCARQGKLSLLHSGALSAALELPPKQYSEAAVSGLQVDGNTARDTIRVTGPDGREVYIMNAVLDEETGEMVATERLDAAVVTARFSNVAERGGKVDLKFRIAVPAAMQDSHWQLRFYPSMFVLGDSVRLDDIHITGRSYRERELRGYERYRRFLSRIAPDSAAFISYRSLEVFLKRNLPGVYAFRTDSSFVTEQQFRSRFGVSGREAVEHYTRRAALRRNERLKDNRGRMFGRYVKSPPADGGIRLDSVTVSSDGDFIYDYVQTVNVRPGMRKVDIVLSGEVLEFGGKVGDIPATEPLTFYISSVSAFVDPVERYLTRIVSRNAEFSEHRRIVFGQGRHDVDLRLEDNASEIGRVKSTIRQLMADPLYELDSVSISSFASPEGREEYNIRLSERRAESVAEYFGTFVRQIGDSLGSTRKIEFLPRSGGENWAALDVLVASDTSLTEVQKYRYSLDRDSPLADDREEMMRHRDSYAYISGSLYPGLREVRLDFALSRKDMIKDTVVTTQLDTAYMRGVQCIRDYDYETALSLLEPYADINTAVAYVALGRNRSALAILSGMEKTATVDYMLALVHSRLGDDAPAVEHYLNSCRQDRSMISRGNLDPEIYTLVRRYGLDDILYEITE